MHTKNSHDHRLPPVVMTLWFQKPIMMLKKGTVKLNLFIEEGTGTKGTPANNSRVEEKAGNRLLNTHRLQYNLMWHISAFFFKYNYIKRCAF